MQQNATGADTSKFLKKVDLGSLKSEVDKLDIDKLEKVTTSLNSLKNKVDKLDVDKLAPVPVDLSKLRDVVKNDIVKKGVYNAKIKVIEDKIPNITNITNITNFCLGTISKNLTKDEQTEISLNDTVYDFSADYTSIEKVDILDIHQHLIIKNNIK